ncbi:MAG: hypothetical protein ACJAVW_003604, partial [Spirosomataceae bacterium]
TEELKKTLELENEGLHLDTKTSKPKEQ